MGGSCPEVAADNEPGDERPSNTFVLAGPDGTIHRYRKIHPFSYAGEEKYVRPGDTFVTVEVNGLRLSLFVCYDLRFADEFCDYEKLRPAAEVIPDCGEEIAPKRLELAPAQPLCLSCARG